MSLNEVPQANRPHIAFFGCRNAGKSTVVNAVTGQALSIVSDQKGTTTDPVSKAMELLPLGPVVIIDTPGIDDIGGLGEMRVAKARQVLARADICVLIVDGSVGMCAADQALLEQFKKAGVPHLIVYNKKDLCPASQDAPDGALQVSGLTGEGIWALKERIAQLGARLSAPKPVIADLVRAGDYVVLVCPIDEAAPKGRMILPQQMVMRELLDVHATALLTQPQELPALLAELRRSPAMVITDSQAFASVSPAVPQEVPLTSFSILLARMKGFLQTAAEGAAAIRRLKDGDTVLMAEGCTHHRQCNDIGTVKIPALLRKTTGRHLTFESCSGQEFPEDLSRFALIIHCGGCMITERAVQVRMRSASAQGIPFTNYGLALASMTGTLERSVRLFPEIHSLFA